MEKGTEFLGEARPGAQGCAYSLYLSAAKASSQVGQWCVLPHQTLMLLFWVVMSTLLLGSSESKLWVPRRPLTRV